LLNNSITITYNALSVTLNRVAASGFESTYFGTTGNDKITMNVKHQIPARGKSGESHLIRLDAEMYDASGIYYATASSWMVIKTFDGVQVDLDSTRIATALADFVKAGTNMAQIVGRES